MSRKVRLALLLTAFVLAAVVFRNPLLGAAGAYLVNATPPQPADVILVLAGDHYGNRILEAGKLVRQGLAPRALISGPSGEYGSYECDLAIPFAVRHGYPESYFGHLEHDARSTAEEAAAVVPALRKTGARRVLLVTSDYHTRRAGYVFRRAAPDLEFIVVAAPDSDFSAQGWWRSREGRKIALYEWMKTVAYWFGV